MRPSLLFLIAVALAATAGAARAQSLYWVDTNYGAPTVNQADDNGTTAATVAQPVGALPEGIATDAAGNVYWVESAWSGARVHRAAADLTGTTAIAGGGSANRGVAIDAVHQLVYWTTSNLATGATIQRASLTGAGATTLITLGAGANPRGISVDRVAGKIYWADFDLNAIYRANLDGTGAALWLATGPGSAPFGVVVDPAEQLVYWTEYGNGIVRRATTAGGGVTNLVFGFNPTYLALDVAGDRLFWAEAWAGSQRIRRATTTGAALVTLGTPLTTYGGLAYSTYGLVPVEESRLPAEIALDRVWPSPGRGAMHVAFSLPRAAHTRLAVFDLQGREVAVLAEGQVGAGRHERVWNGGAGRVAAGVYFVRLEVDGRAWTRRTVVTP